MDAVIERTDDLVLSGVTWCLMSAIVGTPSTGPLFGTLGWAGFLSRRENDVRAEPDIAEPNQFQILVGFGQIPDSTIFGTCARWNRTGTKEPDRAPVLPPLT